MIPFLIFTIVLVILIATLNFNFGWELHLKLKHLYLKTYRTLKNNSLKAKEMSKIGESSRKEKQLKREKKKSKICTQCGAVNNIKYKEEGSEAVGCVLLCFLIIPGLLYLIMKRFTRYAVCGSCGANALVGGDTPVGRELLKNKK